VRRCPEPWSRLILLHLSLPFAGTARGQWPSNRWTDQDCARLTFVNQFIFTDAKDWREVYIDAGAYKGHVRHPQPPVSKATLRSSAWSYAYVKRHPEGNDRCGKLLPIIHVLRSELNGELDISVGNSEIETEKAPLGATIPEGNGCQIAARHETSRPEAGAGARRAKEE
jgi:hypothetical protein